MIKSTKFLAPTPLSALEAPFRNRERDVCQLRCASTSFTFYTVESTCLAEIGKNKALVSATQEYIVYPDIVMAEASSHFAFVGRNSYDI
jgi:hypothetical protein